MAIAGAASALKPALRAESSCSIVAQVAKICETSIAISGLSSRASGVAVTLADGRMNLNGCGMAKIPDSKTKEIELLPNPWKTFERAVDVVAKSPPEHRVKAATAKKSPKRPRPKRRP
jgi:hypothetical protein